MDLSGFPLPLEYVVAVAVSSPHDYARSHDCCSNVAGVGSPLVNEIQSSNRSSNGDWDGYNRGNSGRWRCFR